MKDGIRVPAPDRSPALLKLGTTLRAWQLLTAQAWQLAASLSVDNDGDWYLEGPLDEHEDPTWAVLGDGASWEMSTRSGNPGEDGRAEKLAAEIASFFAAQGAAL